MQVEHLSQLVSTMRSSTGLSKDATYMPHHTQSGAETEILPEGVKTCHRGFVSNSAAAPMQAYEVCPLTNSRKAADKLCRVASCNYCLVSAHAAVCECALQTEDEVLTTMEELQEMDISLQILQVAIHTHTKDSRL